MGYKFTSVLPAKSLNSIVKNFFVIEFDKDTAHTDYLLPDGFPSFFYIQTSEPIDAYFGETGRVICVRDGFYVGYSNTVVEFEHKRLRIAGASVFPVYLSMIFGKSPQELINRFIRLEDTDAFKPVALLRNASESSYESIFSIFEKYISDQLDKHEFNEDFSLIYEKLTGPGGYYLSVEELADYMGCSTRHLHSRFKRFFGMSPKTFMKLVRFNHALKYIYDIEKGMNLSSIAHEVGYHDQSHFIPDFKDICGKTPKEISANSSSLANKFCLF